MRGKLFNEEKILYFANEESAFHVQPNEPNDSDISNLVRYLWRRGLIEQKSSGDSGTFYTITRKGRIRLLELQIKWRREHGKDAANHERELIRLEGIDNPEFIHAK